MSKVLVVKLFVFVLVTTAATASTLVWDKLEAYVEMTPEQMRDIMLQRSPGGLETLPEEDRERVKATTDSQFDKALEILRKKL